MSTTAYEPVIGLEIHVQLKTRTKMFCGCALSFGEEPNTRTCPICLGLPGTLPVTNAQAVTFGIMMGMALGCEIAPRSIFHRKNYFYPDLSKGYQISQYDIPLCVGGHLGDVRIHRIHLEEDAAKLVHLGESGRIHGSDSSIVDYNRGGTPLAEIVSEPDIHSAEQARDWLQLLRETLRQLGVSDVNMEEGSLRCDANVSIRPVGSTELGTKTELKNMNSFRFVMQGINAEIARQTALLEAGEAVTQETLHFDPVSGRISSLRSKEEAHDYRYFPEPDLVPIVPTQEMLDAARAAIGELPAERSARYVSAFGLPEDTAHLFAFEPEWGAYFEAAAEGAADARVDGDLGHGAALARRRLGRARLAGQARDARRRQDGHRRGRPHDSRQAGRRGRRPGRDRRARGPDRDLRQRRARGDRRQGDRREPRHRRAHPGRQRQGDGRARRSDHAGDQGPRGRRRGQPPAAVRAWSLTSASGGPRSSRRRGSRSSGARARAT